MSAFETMLNRIVEFLPRVLGAAIIVFAGWLLKMLIMRIIGKILKKKVEPLMHMFIRNSAVILIWIVIIIAAMAELGINTTSVITMLGTAGVAISLALQGSLSNIASGLLLMVSKVLRGGDFVSINGVEGKVISTDLMFTHLDTTDNKHIAVPNSGITATNIINYTYNATRRVDLEFTAGYEDDISRVKAALEHICENTVGILNEPAYSINVKGYDDSAIRYSVKVWCARDNYWDVYFAVTEKVKEEFDRRGISIPFNQIDVHFFPPAEEKTHPN
ncbi:MAG: mechanosensitive ion channel [Oscillospiraceae bacterium]|nr:MAG: mechanosensitive ion channel [Oscillospiraceae bacterium]